MFVSEFCFSLILMVIIAVCVCLVMPHLKTRPPSRRPQVVSESTQTVVTGPTPGGGLGSGETPTSKVVIPYASGPTQLVGNIQSGTPYITAVGFGSSKRINNLNNYAELSGLGFYVGGSVTLTSIGGAFTLDSHTSDLNLNLQAYKLTISETESAFTPIDGARTMIDIPAAEEVGPQTVIIETSDLNINLGFDVTIVLVVTISSSENFDLSFNFGGSLGLQI